MIYSLVKDNIVVNRISAPDRATADKIALEQGCTVSTAKNAQMGFEKVGSSWVDKRPSVTPPKNTLNELIDLLESKGSLTPSEATSLKG